MTPEDPKQSAEGFFLLILTHSVIAAIMGGLIAFAVALISRDYAISHLNNNLSRGLLRVAISIGIIRGLYTGVAVSSFACFLGVLKGIIRSKTES